jgi:trehalose 6-phosphate synthase/phosphatase
MLVPGMLRRLVPDARIGFFLHIPFPSSEVFRVLPWRDELLRGLLGADLVGFHTLAYVRHFAASLLRLLGLEVGIDRLVFEGREVRVTALPMGIDVAHFEELAADPAIAAEAAQLRPPGGAKLVLGVDRLDYTKGIPRRLLAFERLLERRRPEDPQVQLLQVAVTSRGEVSEYRSFKRSVDELVGRINGRFGTPDYTPIRYLNTGVDSRGVTALYRAADVMLVTPLRDGLNLVAKEFVAARVDGDGVLVLSEFAGAASELPDAILFNPYSQDDAADAVERALAMPEDERRRRMASLRDTVGQHDVHAWVRTFLEELSVLSAGREAPLGDGDAALAALAGARLHGHLVVVLDYDGTLVGFGPRPELMVPDAELRELLGALASRPGLDVHIVSGRSRDFLERHFGAWRLGLHAEHGAASRLAGEDAWHVAAGITPEWRERVRALLERVVRHVPGARLEVKEQSVAFHYRQVDPAFAATVVKELRLHLLELLSNVAAAVVEQVCSCVSSSAARFRIADPPAARALLRTLLG